MMSGPYIQVDETPIKYLDPGNGKTGQGYFWVAHRPGEDVLFEWHTTREAKCLQKLIPIDFNGTVQCDGYSAYDHFARHRASEGKPILLAGCWASSPVSFQIIWRLFSHAIWRQLFWSRSACRSYAATSR